MSIIVRKLIQKTWNNIAKNDNVRIAAQSPTPGITDDKNLIYENDGDPMHQVDICYPDATEGLLPVVFDVHGGGWLYGDKELNKYFCLSLAKHGFAVSDLSYRLIPATDLKGQVQDVFKCLHWLAENGADHHCDITKVCLTGDSAGGHLASLVTAIDLDPNLRALYGVEKLPFKIHAVAINHGVVNLHVPMTNMKSVHKEYQRMWFGKNPEKNPIYEKSSFQETADPKTYPPLFILTSEADDLYKHSQALIEYVKKAGFQHVTIIPSGDGPHGKEQLGHVFNVLYPEWEESGDVNKQILNFFRANL